jgi:hypothetical protein
MAWRGSSQLTMWSCRSFCWCIVKRAPLFGKALPTLRSCTYLGITCSPRQADPYLVCCFINNLLFLPLLCSC